MKFCDDCGGMCKVKSEIDRVEDEVRYERRKYKCLNCGEMHTDSETTLITDEQEDGIGRGVSTRDEHPIETNRGP